MFYLKKKTVTKCKQNKVLIFSQTEQKERYSDPLTNIKHK